MQDLSFPAEFGIATPVGEPGGEQDEVSSIISQSDRSGLSDSSIRVHTSVPRSCKLFDCSSYCDPDTQGMLAL